MRIASILRHPLTLSLLAVLLTNVPIQAQTQGLRPMTFMDAQEMRRAGSWEPSPDGQWMLYTITSPNWEEAESQSDIHIVSLDRGVSSSRQLTFTEGKNE